MHQITNLFNNCLKTSFIYRILGDRCVFHKKTLDKPRSNIYFYYKYSFNWCYVNVFCNKYFPERPVTFHAWQA